MLPPINLAKWIEQHQDKLKPPVGNFLIDKSNDFIIMCVGGPNKRTDYHINQTSEWFYQIKGDMVLKIVNKDDEFVDISIKEGETFLLEGNIPHSPKRFENTIGIVIEKNRNKDDVDVLRWYCEKCKNIVCEKRFFCSDITVQIKQAIFEYESDSEQRKCLKCGFLNN